MQYFGKLFCTLGIALSFYSCGFENPYKKKDVKCKINCENTSNNGQNINNNEQNTVTFPRNTSATKLNISDYDKVTKRSTLKKEEILGFLQVNPLVTASNFIDSTFTLVDKLKANKDLESPQKLCLDKVFSNKGTLSNNEISLTADYGKCLDYRNFSQKDSSGKIMLFNEYEAAIKFERYGEFVDPKLIEVKSFYDLESFMPFNLLGDSSVVKSDESGDKYLLSKVALQGFDVIENNKVIQNQRAWHMNSLGWDKGEPFMVAKVDNKRILNGSFFDIYGEANNISTPGSYEGQNNFGYSMEYAFINFSIEGAQQESDLKIWGFNKDSVLNGNYAIRINDFLFLAEAQNKPCMVELFQIFQTKDQKDGTKESLGKLNLCELTK